MFQRLIKQWIQVQQQKTNMGRIVKRIMKSNQNSFIAPCNCLLSSHQLSILYENVVFLITKNSSNTLHVLTTYCEGRECRLINIRGKGKAREGAGEG